MAALRKSFKSETYLIALWCLDALNSLYTKRWGSTTHTYVFKCRTWKQNSHEYLTKDTDTTSEQHHLEENYENAPLENIGNGIYLPN